MVNLSVKNVPEDLVERLRERAERHHRSLQGELLSILEQSAIPQGLTPREVYERVTALGLRTGPDSVRMVREDRDAR